MNDEERNTYVKDELEAIYEEIDSSITHLIILRRFLKNLVEVSQGKEPNYENIIKILNRMQK